MGTNSGGDGPEMDARRCLLSISHAQADALGEILLEVVENHEGWLRCIEEDRADRHNHVADSDPRAAEAHAEIDRECNVEMGDAISRYEVAREILEALR